ncbi:MAG: permease [Planctomycetes bacterium]|nr:permease [Planctomycetota bacterium]
MDQYIINFTSIVYEALPFIVLGVILAGLLEEFVPQQFITRVTPSNRAMAIALGCLLGLVFPMCECGIIPVMKRLLRKGLPLSLCVSYMLAGPIINIVVIMSTYVAFKNPIFGGSVAVVALRVGLGFVVAYNVGLIVDRLWRRHGTDLLAPSVAKGLDQPSNDEVSGRPRTLMDRLNNITATALGDFIDILAFLIIGALLAAGGRAMLDSMRPAPNRPSSLELELKKHPALAILMMMALAVLLCLCSEADAFVAANFPDAWAPAAKLAFLVLGPMMDLKLFFMYTRVFRQKLIWTIIVAVVIQVFAYCLILNYLEVPVTQHGQALQENWDWIMGLASSGQKVK